MKESVMRATTHTQVFELLLQFFYSALQLAADLLDLLTVASNLKMMIITGSMRMIIMMERVENVHKKFKRQIDI